MSQQTLSSELSTSFAQVWTSLTADLQERIIRLMAQLALNLVVSQSNWPGKECSHDLIDQHKQDSARTS
jgi:hypothetical protein